jgi:hypothetical protein
MSELSPELEELVLACRGASLPTEADSARILAALRVRLGDAAVLGAEATQAAAIPASSGFLFGKVSAISLAGLALLGGIWLFAARNHREASSASNTPTSVAATLSATPLAQHEVPPSVPTPTAAATGVAAVENSNSEPADSSPTASRHPRDRLAEEVSLLSRAEMALHSGKPGVALDVLNEHERRFGNGLLREERVAARVQALCALGRKAEADAQLSQLSSKSLHGAQPGQACISRKND